MDSFSQDLEVCFKIHKVDEYLYFQKVVLQPLNKHASVKKKMLHFNNNHFMPRALREAIMHRSKLKNIYNKCRTEGSCSNYKKQINFCVNLLRKAKVEYFLKLNVKDLPDHKKFWERMKPYFSNKGLNSNNIMWKKITNILPRKKSKLL